MKKEEQELLERDEENESQEEGSVVDQQVDGLENEFDREFWIKVRQKQSEEIPWVRAMDEVRVERLIQRFQENGELVSEDPALVMLKKWPASKQYQANSNCFPGLEQQINRFLEILLKSELNVDNRYETFRDEDDKTKKTLMHYAAELGFLQVTETLVKNCPGLLATKTKAQLKPEKKRGLLPVELALTMENDDVAAYLIRMMWHERVQSLFSWRPGDMSSPQPSYFSFKSIIENSKMKKSVVAILDQMVNPHWSHLPKRKQNYDNQEEEEGIEGAWSTIPDDPFDCHFYYHILDGDEKSVVAILDQMVSPHWLHLPKRKDNYDNQEEEEGIEGAWSTIPDDPYDCHFYYHILDGDKAGRPPKVMASEGNKLMVNKYFHQHDKSCLHLIAKSNNKEALQHPVVRMLIKTKWQSYGHRFLCLQAGFYVIFLLLLSYSLMYGSTRLDPTHYMGIADSLRGFCEILTLVMVVFYIFEEINQIRKERHLYFKEWMNLFDWLGLVLILCIIPLRYSDSKAQWMVASLAFLFSYLRIFKFSCVTRTTGLYTKTLAKIIRQDVTRFMIVFAVVFLSFCGSLFLSLSSSKQSQQFSGFDDVLLSVFRVLSEQQPIAEDYSSFNWLSILLMLAYMGTVIVILLNILIAQMSTTYTLAKRVARLEYDVDRILLLTRMERFPVLNLRVRYYKKGDWISEMKLAKELLEFSEDRHPWESVEEKLDAIRDMMRSMVKQMRTGRQ